MENKSVSELTLSFLLTAALCVQATVIERSFNCPTKKMNWTDARTYCQKNYIDLATWDTVNPNLLAKWLGETQLQKVWIGLHRDPKNDSVWKWVDIKTGKGLSGDDLSQSSYWVDEQQGSLCAFVSSNLKLYSDECSNMHSAYCTEGNHTEYYDGNFTWYKAYQFCQNRSSNLTIITNPNKHDLPHTGWIGLYQEAYMKWKWIGDQPSNYSKWAPGEPIIPDCGSFSPVSGKWYSSACSQRLQFVCYYDNLVVVNENKTWEEAVGHCRGMTIPCDNSSGPCIYHDLLSLPYLEDYSYIRDRIYSATTDEVWTGLRFLGGQWWWLNGQVPGDQGMLPECPSQQGKCGTLSKYDTDNWIIRDCSERRNFVCLRYTVDT